MKVALLKPCNHLYRRRNKARYYHNKTDTWSPSNQGLTLQQNNEWMDLTKQESPYQYVKAPNRCRHLRLPFAYKAYYYVP
ncbi:hypothetical protein LguiA_033796 [Lonicera macranthoides]